MPQNYLMQCFRVYFSYKIKLIKDSKGANVYACMCVHKYAWVCVHLYMCACVCVLVCMYICMYNNYVDVQV